MYICPKHGRLDNHWCDICSEIYNCDCSITDTTRYKDLEIECEDGTKSITIYIEHCQTCGAVFDIRK